MLYVGVMSGTSLDGIDAVVSSFSEDKFTILGHSYQAFSESLIQALKQLQQHTTNEIHLSQVIAIELAKCYGQTIFQLLESLNISKECIKAVGAHGQTIRHQPKLGYTLQLNAPAYLAEFLGIDIVTDFRSRDIAAGGQGAPLVPAFHCAVFSVPHEKRGILNLGGVANLTVLPALNNEEEIIGYDIGPCNILLNEWIDQNLNLPFDDGGRWASQGQVNEAFLLQLMETSFLKLSPPKSTGRDDFHLHWLKEQVQQVRNQMLPMDVARTLVEWIALFCVEAFQVHHIHSGYVCGGGVFNSLLMERLKFLSINKSIQIDTTEKLGIPPMQVEAMAFAWLAKQCVERKTGNLPSVTGAKGKRILGAVYPA
jgi:anhydro-N-acetylmuramic acid kinase